jgi:hypothetical protein
VKLDPRTAMKLAKICARFASNYDAERATAAALADQLLRSMGLSWEHVLLIQDEHDFADLVDFALRHESLLNSWERGFVRDIRQRETLSRKQRAKLDAIVRQIHNRKTAA